MQSRVQAVCEQLQADISRMKLARAAVQRRMEAKEKEYREWRLMREREVLQLRRNAQRQTAALQQHQAMHNKQQVINECANAGMLSGQMDSWMNRHLQHYWVADEMERLTQI